MYTMQNSYIERQISVYSTKLTHKKKNMTEEFRSSLIYAGANVYAIAIIWINSNHAAIANCIYIVYWIYRLYIYICI